MAHSVVFFFFSSVSLPCHRYLLPGHSHQLPLPLASTSRVAAAGAVDRVVQTLRIQSLTPLVSDTTEPLYSVELYGGVIQMGPFHHYDLLLFGWTKLRNDEELVNDVDRICTGLASSVGSVLELGLGYYLS